MSKELKAYMEARQKLLAGFQERWLALNTEATELAKSVPEFIAPWNAIRHVAGVHLHARKGMKDLCLEMLDETVEGRLTVAQVTENLARQGYKYGYSYVYNTLTLLSKEKEAIGGFRVKKIQPDSDGRPSYYKVKENAVATI